MPPKLASHDLSATSNALPAPEATRAALSGAQVDAMLDAGRQQDRRGNDDLIALGAAAIGDVIRGWFVGRL